MDRLKPCPPFDPTKLPKMEILPKDRSLNNILFQSAEIKEDKGTKEKEPIKPKKQYEGLMLMSMGTALPAIQYAASNDSFKIEKIFNKDPNDIEYLYNIKSLLYGAMQYLIAQRGILVQMLYNVNSDLLFPGASGLQDDVLKDFITSTPGYVSDFRLLCMHINLPLTYVQYAKLAIPSTNFKNLQAFLQSKQYRQELWRSPKFSHSVVNRDIVRANQIDNAFKYKRPFRLRRDYTYNSIALNPISGDYHHMKRYLNGYDTSYNYADVMLKSARPPVAPVDHIGINTYDALSTQFPTLQDIVYLHRPDSTEKKAYEPIVLNCQQENPPPQLRLLEYIEKEQRMIEKLRSDINQFVRLILRNIQGKPVKNILSLNKDIPDALKPLVRIVTHDTIPSIELTDYSTWMMSQLSKSPLSLIYQTQSSSAIPATPNGYKAPRSGGTQKCLLP
jgi:hypothetical protein